MTALLPMLRFWKYGVMALLLLALAVQTGRMHHWHKRADAEAAAHKQTIANYRGAQKAAKDAALAAKAAQEALYAKKAKEADDDLARTRRVAQDATARYAAEHRCLRPEGAGRNASPAHPAAENHNPGVPEAGPGDAVVVTTDDLHICTDNSVKLMAAHEWVLSLGNDAK